MAIATAAGAILALAILAMTVGLIRSESAGDLRTLTATGATPYPPHADRHHRRGARPPRRAPRRRRCLRRPCGAVSRQARLSERRAGPLPRPRSHRGAAGRRRGRMAPRRPRAARHRKESHRVTRHRSRALALLLVLAALAATVAGCGGGDDDAGAVATTAATTTTPSADRTWKKVVPGGDCQCSDGSEFSFWVREASPQKVVLYLQDGGACFSAETCAPENDLYNDQGQRRPDRAGWHVRFRRQTQPLRRPLGRLCPLLHGRRAHRQRDDGVRPRPHRPPQRVTSTAPPPSTTWPLPFAAQPRSSWLVRAPAR